jgi:hypothetical protein
MSSCETRRRWEDNIKMFLGEIWCEDVDSIRVTQDRVRWQASVIGRESSGALKGEEFLGYLVMFRQFDKNWLLPRRNAGDRIFTSNVNISACKTRDQMQ